jgi:SAM-dependent methyltransferase
VSEVRLRSTWDRQAEEWAEFARSPEYDHFYWAFNRPQFLALLPRPGRLTVDVGCGEGRLTAELSDLGHRVVAVDGSPRMATIARRRPELEAVVIADAAGLPLCDEAADLVVAFMSLQDMDDVADVIAECGRVLLSGGRFCLAIAHPVRSAGSFTSKSADADFVISPYFDARIWPWRSSHSGLAVSIPGMHRPLEAYTRALEQAGLVIERIREPRPSEEVVEGRETLARWRRVPCFLHIRALKPG